MFMLIFILTFTENFLPNVTPIYVILIFILLGRTLFMLPRLLVLQKALQMPVLLLFSLSFSLSYKPTEVVFLLYLIGCCCRRARSVTLDTSGKKLCNKCSTNCYSGHINPFLIFYAILENTWIRKQSSCCLNSLCFEHQFEFCRSRKKYL